MDKNIRDVDLVSKMRRSILTVFEGSIDEWIDGVVDRVSSALESENEVDTIEGIIEEELNKVSEKIEGRGYEYVVVVEGNFEPNRYRKCKFMTVEGFLDKIYRWLSEDLSMGRVQGLGGLRRKVNWSKGEKSTLEAMMDLSIPVIGSEEVYDWIEEVAQEIAKEVDLSYDAEDVYLTIRSEKIIPILERLKSLGFEYVNLMEGFSEDLDFEGKCEVMTVERFVRYLWDSVFYRVHDILS